MTREEAEKALQKKYLGRIIGFTDIRDFVHTGKLHRITAWPDKDNNELMVIFVLDQTRHEVDINYFLENTTIHGDSPGRDQGSPGV